MNLPRISFISTSSEFAMLALTIDKSGESGEYLFVSKSLLGHKLICKNLADDFNENKFKPGILNQYLYKGYYFVIEWGRNEEWKTVQENLARYSK